MMPEGNYDEGNIEGQMSQTQNAKINAQFFRKAAQVCDAANIILVVINHITENLSVGVTPPSAQINFLKQNESLPGGSVAKFMTDTLIKITTSTKLEPDKTWGIKGFEAKVEICKSRHAPAGRAVNMIYDQTNGFRNDLSMLDYIKACGLLKGNGMAYYIEGHPEFKFRLATYKNMFDTNDNFRNIIEATAKACLQASIKESDNIKIQEDAAAEEEAIANDSE